MAITEEARAVSTVVKPEPGNWYDGITNEAYHRGIGVSKSGLATIKHKSPLHYDHDRRNPRTGSTPAFDLGTATHTLVLEPHLAEQDLVVAPEINKRTKAGKEEWAAFEEANKGKTVLTPEQHALATAMADAVHSHEAAAMMLGKPEDRVCERSFYWEDGPTGAICRVRPDCLNIERGYIVDLKTTVDASPEGFAKQCANFSYGMQSAFYLDGVNLVLTDGNPGDPDQDLPVAGFVFIAVEKDPPHAVGVYVAPDDMLLLGRQDYREALELYARCLTTRTWPGYAFDWERMAHIVTPTSLPPWERKRIETGPMGSGY